MIGRAEPVLELALIGMIVSGGLFLVAGDTPTGFLTLKQQADVSVATETNGELSKFAVERIFTIGNSTQIDVEISNRGSTRISPVTFTVEILNVNNTLLYRYPAPDVALEPGSIFSRTITHTPHRTGSFIARIEAQIGGDTVRTSEFFFVLEEPQPPKQEPTVIVRKRRKIIEPEPAPQPSEPLTRRSWQVDAPNEVTLEQGGRTTIPVQITNQGNVPVKNVRLTTRSSGNISVDYDPKIIFAIQPNSTRTFSITLSAPRDIVADTSTVSFQVRSANLGESGEITVNVRPTLTLQQLRDQIESIELLLQEASAEISTASRGGANLTGARAELRQARDALREAKAAVNQTNIKEARTFIGSARNHTNAAFQELFQRRARQLEVRAELVKPAHILILFAVIVAALMVGIYYYLRQEQEERPKLLREMEEE